MKKIHPAILVASVAVVAAAPGKVSACAACYGANIDAPMAEGMNWAIFTLGAVIATVLGAFLTFLVYAIRRSEALEAARQQAATPAANPQPASAPKPAADIALLAVPVAQPQS